MVLALDGYCFGFGIRLYFLDGFCLVLVSITFFGHRIFVRLIEFIKLY
jgi:hypothetical protein